MEDSDTAQGKAQVSGYEVLFPNPRRVGVARAYVEGLERDRGRLHEMESNVNETIWEMIQLSSWSRALYIALYQLLRDVESDKVTDELLERINNLLEANPKVYDDVWSCACGHSKFDHDADGCMYLGCRPICGRGVKPGSSSD